MRLPAMDPVCHMLLNVIYQKKNEHILHIFEESVFE